jgi:Cap4 dsDNA endonuclease
LTVITPFFEPPLQQVVSDLFRDFKGDETGGKHAIRGFNYQVWHAVLEAIRAYQSGGDYAVVLEWQQDIAVLNSSTKPTQVRFIQLKKNESSLHWTFESLLAAEKAAAVASSTGQPDTVTGPGGTGVTPKAKKAKLKPSILAKLYNHRRRFGTVEHRLEFASDAQFKIPAAAGLFETVSYVEVADLPPAALLELETRLRQQLEVPLTEVIDLKNFCLQVSDCPVSEPHKYLAGELAEMQMGSELRLSGSATVLAVLVIASYVNLRAGHHKKFAKNFDELLERAVTREDISKYLSAANDQTIPTQDHIQSVVDRLNAELAPQALVREMRKEVTRACVDIAVRQGPAFLLAAHLKALLDSNPAYQGIELVKDLLDIWYKNFCEDNPSAERTYKRGYLYCLMAMIIEDAKPVQHLPSVPPHSQFEDGK